MRRAKQLAEHQAAQLTRKCDTLSNDLAAARRAAWDAHHGADAAAEARAAAAAEVGELKLRLQHMQAQAQETCAALPCRWNVHDIAA